MPKNIYLLSPTIKDNIKHLPMIQFRLLVNEVDLGNCDTLMFTSKEAVKSVDRLNKMWKKYPSLAIGSATAKQIVELGGRVEYNPSSFYGEELSKDIIKKFKDRKILYLRPKVVSFDSQAFLLKSNIFIEEQIIYETTCIPYDTSKELEKESIIIFTSPSTIRCFFKNFNWDTSYIAVVIGESTKEHLRPDMQCEVADEATIEACIAKALEVKV